MSRRLTGWSTDGSTSRSTGSRPARDCRQRNGAVSVGFPPSGATITSSIWRRIRVGIAGLEGVGCPSNSRSYRWGRRRSRSYTEGSGRNPLVSGAVCRDPACSRGKMPMRLGAEVYRNSTDGLYLGKYPAKAAPSVAISHRGDSAVQHVRTHPLDKKVRRETRHGYTSAPDRRNEAMQGRRSLHRP
jgi:hypothetical protein